MRSYGQYCSMARSLDVVGDRWALLIVRELLTQGDCRYSDLRRGLPGMASNLLAQRLRELEESGVISRRMLPPPVATSVYTLTDRGRELRGIVRELVRWGAPLMAPVVPGDQFRAHWLSLPLNFLCRDSSPDEPKVVVRIGDLQDGCDVIADGGVIEVLPVSANRTPDAIVGGPPQLLVALFTGQLSPDAAVSAGIAVEGTMSALRRILPSAPVGSAA